MELHGSRKAPTMETSFKARKMVPGKDTIKVMATHYGLLPSDVRNFIKKVGVQVIREDGFKGTLTNVGYRIVGWSDGQVGVDVSTTKLTRAAISAVSSWAHEKNSSKNDSDI